MALASTLSVIALIRRCPQICNSMQVLSTHAPAASTIYLDATTMLDVVQWKRPSLCDMFTKLAGRLPWRGSCRLNVSQDDSAVGIEFSFVIFTPMKPFGSHAALIACTWCCRLAALLQSKQRPLTGGSRILALPVDRNICVHGGCARCSRGDKYQLYSHETMR